MADPHDRQGASAAASALADIERQQTFVTQRLGGFSWRPPVVAIVLAVATASLAYRDGGQGYGERLRQVGVQFAVVQVIYLAALVALVGTPVRVGVIPRDSRQSQGRLIALGAVLLPVPYVAVFGPWWTAIAAGTGAGVAVFVLSRWRLAAILREARRPPRVDVHGRHPVADRIVAVSPLVVVIAVTFGSVLASTAPDRARRVVGELVYFLAVATLFVVQRRIGVLPPALRAGLFRKALLVAAALWIPAILTSVFPSLRGNWWVAGCCGLGAAITVATVHRWQHKILRHQAPATGPIPVEGADE